MGGWRFQSARRKDNNNLGDSVNTKEGWYKGWNNGFFWRIVTRVLDNP
jgi:hypothetical protein